MKLRKPKLYILLVFLGVALALFSVLHRNIPSLITFETRPVALRPEALGKFSYSISTDNPEAQAYFNQGFQLRYAFAKQDAVASFREAEKLDSNCAMCYWGEAWAWGHYLNEPMTPEEASKAHRASQKALARSRQGSPEEQALIKAMALRYAAKYDPETQPLRDQAYAQAMAQVAQQYPGDLDAATLYGEALFLLEPRRGSRDIENPRVQKLLSVFESVLEQNIHHGGACHLYIHATEATTQPERAEACAEHISDAIPAVSHINHMPSHTWNEVGRWGDSVEANLIARQTDLKASTGEGFAIYPVHNLQMLLYAASMDGQSQVALQAAQEYSHFTQNISFELLTLLRFGHFDQIIALKQRPTEEMAAGIWDFAQGYSQLRHGKLVPAKRLLAQLQQDADLAQSVFRQSSVKDLLNILAGLLEGEIKRAEGDLSGAIVAQRKAVTIEDQLVFDEPEQLPFSARHWLGASLLESQDYSQAEQVYRAALQDHPHNGWSLLGLQSALKAQGQSTEQVDQELADSWARADLTIQASRF